MNFLELCQAVAVEAGISGSISSVSGQSGEAMRVVKWVKRAYNAIQLLHSEWQFLRADAVFTTTANNDTYSAAAAGLTGFGEWLFRGDDWRCYKTADGHRDEQPVKYMKYDRFRHACQYGSQRDDRNRPQVFTVAPNQRVMFWPTPDDTYTIVGEQMLAPMQLVENADTPIFAARFHDAIMWRAMMYYGEYEGDATVFSAAQNELKPIIGQMEAAYLPEWDTEPVPLA